MTAVSPMDDGEFRRRSASPMITAEGDALSIASADGVVNFSCLRYMADSLRGDPRTKLGRFVQIAEIMVVASLAIAGILVQVYSDAEQSGSRLARSARLQSLNKLTFEMYDIILLLSAEMEPFYEYSRGSYDVFLQKAQIAMRNLDSELLLLNTWPTDFSALGADQHQNITSPFALRTALRLMRDTRKATNGTSEEDVINFYSGLIDKLATLINGLTMKADRFPGWDDLLAVFYCFETHINFRNYALVGKKLVKENRTVSFDDPVYRSLLTFFHQYGEFLSSIPLASDNARRLAKNFTDQESIKNVERIHGHVSIRDFGSMAVDEWVSVTSIHDANIMWMIQQLRVSVQIALEKYSSAWDNADIFSVIIFVIASVTTVVTLAAHFRASWRVQTEVVESYQHLETLNKAFSLIYDCIPRSFVKTYKSGDVFPARIFTDTCVMMMDITNASGLMESLEPSEFMDTLTHFFETFENRLVKYRCFKIDVLGDSICLASGIGEHHATSHIGEMLYLALELQGDFEPTNLEKENNIHLRIGMHAGSCLACIFRHLRIPQVGIFGSAMRTAAMVHATGLGMKVHVSSAIYNRMYESEEIDFVHRGALKTEGKKVTIGTYWARWAEAGYIDEDAESVARLTQQVPPSKQT